MPVAVLRRLAAKAPPSATPRAAISSPEWRWLALVSVSLLVLVEVPYLLAYAQEARGYVFVGMLWSPHDFARYAGTMREAASSSSWLVHNHLTSEPHAPALIYPLYVALGKLAGLLARESQAVYHGADLASRGVLLLSVYLLGAAVFACPGRRRVAFLLVVGSSGLAFWLLMLGAFVPAIGEQRRFFAAEFNWPELNTFLVLFAPPHLSLGLALLLLATRCYLDTWARTSPGLLGGSALVAFGLGAANPFGLVTLGVVLAAHLGLCWLLDRRLPRGPLISAAVTAAVATPFLAYSALIFKADPFWGLESAQPQPSPPLLSLLPAVAPLLALAAIGLTRLAPGSSPEHRLVLVGLAACLALMYAPLPFQRRLAFGLHPMLGVAAVLGFHSLWQHASAARSRRVRIAGQAGRYGLLLALFPSSVLLYALSLRTAAEPPPPSADSAVFQPVSVRDAAHWLAATMGAEEVVLADLPTSNYLGGLIPGRVFVGHWGATPRYEEKGQAVHQFYYGPDDDATRHHWLRAHGIHYVVFGPHERVRGANPPPTNLRLAYQTPTVSIYEVTAR